MSTTQFLASVAEDRSIPVVDYSYSPEIEYREIPEISIFGSIPRKHKKQRPVSRGIYENSRLCRVNQLNLIDPVIKNIPRGGVLFYTFINDKFHLCFGRDADSNDLTDFGGGKRRNESPIDCAVREGNEESRLAFGNIKPDQVQQFFCLYSSNMLIIFIPVVSPNEMDVRRITEQNFKNKEFLNKRQAGARCYNEISEIVWLNEAQIDNLFSQRPNQQMFAKVRRFIYSCTEFSQSTTIMKNILQTAIKTNSPTDMVWINQFPSLQYSLTPVINKNKYQRLPIRARPSSINVMEEPFRNITFQKNEEIYNYLGEFTRELQIVHSAC